MPHAITGLGTRSLVHAKDFAKNRMIYMTLPGVRVSKGGTGVSFLPALAVSLEQALLIPRPVAVFFRFAFVVLLLAFGNRDFAFHHVIFPIKRGGDDGVAFLVNGFLQPSDLLAVEQEFARAGRVGNKMG
jgi:hypothetical protein